MHLADHGVGKLRSFRGIDVIGKFHINGGSNRPVVQTQCVFLNIIGSLILSFLCNAI